MPADTYPEVREAIDFHYKKIQLDSLAKRRIGIIHATDVLGCMRKTFLQKLTENQNTTRGTRQLEHFWIGECIHTTCDMFAPKGRGELPLAWDVVNDKPVKLWDSENNDLYPEVKEWGIDEWLNILIGERDGLVKFTTKGGDVEECIIDYKTTLVEKGDYKPKTMWDNQKEQLEVYRYMMNKNGLGSPAMGAIIQLNVLDKALVPNILVTRLGKVEEIEERVKSKVMEMRMAWESGELPVKVWTPLCGYCPVLNLCLDGKDIKPKADLVMG